MIKIVAKQTIREDAVERFVDMAKELVAASVKDPGNVFYTLNVNVQKPQEYTIIECWESQEAIQNHMDQPHFKKAMVAMGDMVEGEPVMDMYSEIC